MTQPAPSKAPQGTNGLLYKYYSAPSTDELGKILGYIAKDRTLRATDPRTFNDPFEFKVDLQFTDDIERQRRAYFRDNPRSTETEFLRWREGLTHNFKWHQAQVTRAAYMAKYGVVCFSSACDNQLLWSHYGGSHQGFCVGFDSDILHLLPGLTACGDVMYQDSAPKLDVFTDDIHELVRAVFLHKSACWAYEGEARSVLDKQGIVSYPPHLLHEVVLGCRAAQPLRELALSLGVPAFIMVEDHGSYSLSKHELRKGTTIMSSHF